MHQSRSPWKYLIKKADAIQPIELKKFGPLLQVQPFKFNNCTAIPGSPGPSYHGSMTYILNETTGTVTGNPADAPEVQDTLCAINNSIREKWAFRDHSDAMKIADLANLMSWSLSVCGPERVEAVRQGQRGELDMYEIVFVAKHLQVRTYITTAFTMWTR